VFVDSLLQMQPPGEGELARLRQELAGGGSTQALLGSASELLSAMSHFVGVVSAPRREQFAFRQIDFVALDGRRVLAILVFADNEVQNRVIETRQEFAPGQLEQVANYLNAHFAGLPMAEIRTRLLLELRDARSELEQLLAHSIELAEQALQPAADDMLVAGQTRLMGCRTCPTWSACASCSSCSPASARSCSCWSGPSRPRRAHLHRRGDRDDAAAGRLAGHRPYTANGQVLGVLGVIGPSGWPTTA
jgi:heat-inducible transcriptional repressor